MASQGEDHGVAPSSASSSDSYTSDSESDLDENMPKVAGAAGIRIERKSSSKLDTDGAAPRREKRRKAKRACRPCQVAHLTCSDDRPCSRCVKRGCAHQCKDGVRKKAKYLEDTPAEALVQDRGRPHAASSSFPRQSLPDVLGSHNLYTSQGASPTYPLYTTREGQVSLSRPSVEASTLAYTTAPDSFAASRHLPLTGPSYSMNDYASGTLPQGNVLGANTIQQASFDDLFPHSFDLGGLDFSSFDNRYGAAEFGMLNQMSVGMAESPSGDSPFGSAGSFYPPSAMTAAYEQMPSDEAEFPHQPFSATTRWSNESPSDVKPSTSRYAGSGQHEDPLEEAQKAESTPAFTIGNSAVPSPTSKASPQGMTLAGSFDDAPSNMNAFTNPDLSSNQAQTRPHPPSAQPTRHSHAQAGWPALPSSMTYPTSHRVQTPSSRRHRNTSTVYEDVTTPYSYTAAFHSLAALIQRRFSPHKTAHIAKALAAIRPSFISCTMKLNKDDLVFMEKCLQRTLWEYEDFISATGTPTIICRRTGEVVAVGKEFSILTGWTANVLLGRETNLNTNQGGAETSSSSSVPGNESFARANSSQDGYERRLNPVNIVDLLDDDSVCEFFTDYAHLAFGDSRGSVITPCKLLKYQTAPHETGAADQGTARMKRRRDEESSTKDSNPPCDSDDGRSNSDDGKVDCMLCWSVKRDVFDIPMLCVMNVLPCM